jgi:hypothetical protein
MDFYILFRGDTEEDTSKECNQLGRYNDYTHVFWNKDKRKSKSGKCFERREGFTILEKCVNENKYLDQIRIIDSNNKKYSIEQFFEFFFSIEKIF